MKQSDSIANLASALLEAQKEISFAAKDSNNPFFKSKYADLPTVIEACKPALNKHNIIFVQFLETSEPGTLALTTRLIHTSGEWLESTGVCSLAKVDPQGYGSAVTYLRRYALAAAVGLYQDDDDGNAACLHTNNHQKKTINKDELIASINNAGDLNTLKNSYARAYKLCEEAKDNSFLSKITDLKDARKEHLLELQQSDK